MKSDSFPEDDIIIQIEVSEGLVLYVIIRLKSHPSDLKTYFNFGQIIIFEQGKKNGYYKGDLVSLECLNQHMDWTTDYFKKLRLCLQEQKKEVSYSFAPPKDDPDSLIRYFKIVFKIGKGADVVGLNVKCDFISTNQVTESLMKEVIAVNNSRTRIIEAHNKTIKNLETEKMVILENMNDIAQAKEQAEAEMLDKFTILFNEKKKRIMALQMELDKYKNLQPSIDTRVLQRAESRTLDDTNPTQLTMYKLGVNGSQADWARTSTKDLKELNKEKENFRLSQEYPSSVPLKMEDDVEHKRIKVNQTKGYRTTLSLSDLF